VPNVQVELSTVTTPEVSALGGKLGARVTLRSLVESFGTAEAASADLFAFNTGGALMHGHDGGFRSSDAVPPEGTSPHRGALADDFTTPPIFQRFLRDAEGGHNMLSLGDAGQGLQFHTHGRSWLALVHGVKEWWIYPPGAMPPAVAGAMMPLHPARVWVPVMSSELLARDASEAHDTGGTTANASAAALWHCVQRAGDALYLPAGWAHATQNLRPSVGE
jgi:hypothetical protein